MTAYVALRSAKLIRAGRAGGPIPTLRERLVKIGARLIEPIPRIRVQLRRAARRQHCSIGSRVAITRIPFVQKGNS
jgi:hypothetical protein